MKRQSHAVTSRIEFQLQNKITSGNEIQMFTNLLAEK
jgi:hypothetical protein